MFPLFYDEISPKLPLRSITPIITNEISGSSPLNGPRQLTFADLEFVPFPIKYDWDLLNSHQKPFLHIFLAATNDVETYRSHLKQKITMWLESIHTKKYQQCLIILINTGDKESLPNPSNNIFTTKTATVIEKIRQDFCGPSQRQNKATQIRIKPSSGIVAWNDLFELFADSIFLGFSQLLLTLEDDVRRIEAQKQLPGWNFCSFFLCKVLFQTSLA